MSLSLRYLRHVVPFVAIVACARTQAGVPWVSTVVVEGNEQVSTGLIKGAMVTRASSAWPWAKRRPFDPAVFRADRARVLALYRIMGHRKAEVVSSGAEDLGKEKGLRVVLVVDEGPRTLVGGVSWKGLPPMRASQYHQLVDKTRLGEGEAYLEGVLVQEQRRVAGLLAEYGYPLAKVAARSDWSHDSLRVDVAFSVQPGPPCRFGPTTFEGLERLKEDDLRKGLLYQEGKPFRRSKLQDTRRQLYSQGLVKYVAITVADTATVDGILPIRIRIREAPQRYVKASAGFGSQDRLRGSLTLGHRNFLGGARNVETSLRASWWRQEANLRLKQPQWPWPRHVFSAGAYVRWEWEESYTARVQGGLVDLSRGSGRYTRVAVSYGVERVTFVGDTEKVKAEMGDAYRNPSVLAALNMGIARDSRADPFWPSAGSASRLTVEAAGLPLRADYRYLKVWLEWSRFARLWRTWVLAGRAGFGSINPLGEHTEVPVHRRFYCGGTHSVRGFSRRGIGPKDADGNPVGGKTLLEGSFEVRFPLRPSVSGVVFTDTGGLWPDYLQVLRTSLEASCGFGVRISSPVGPLSADLAWDLSRRLSRRSVRLHAMVGQAF